MSVSRRKKLEREKKLKLESFNKKNKQIIPLIAQNKVKEFKELKNLSSSNYIRDTRVIPSLELSNQSGRDGQDSKKYTGDYIIGLATTHKSNIVPVGRGESPIEYARMRRN